ncbi:MAG: hypothetical protein OQK40_01085 [Gammaproteobacteria bacterium]|nr:hypothetical protein [Gammaproteobacteria bacterium]
MAIFLFLLHSVVFAIEPTEEELQRWFESDEPGPPQTGYGAGEELEFIAPPPAKPVPRSRTRLYISEQSMEDGWVAVTQCHDGLDPVPDAEVVYKFRQMRGLRITSYEGIAAVRIVGQSIQLKEASRGASLCVELEARILQPSSNGHYRLRYGPFMRRFLDSYFPLHVQFSVSYPAERLHLFEVSPSPSQGFSHEAAAGDDNFDAWFRGKLTFELVFQAN